MLSWFMGKIVQPFLPYIIGGMLVANILAAAFAYWKGYSDASTRCRYAEQQAIIASQARDLRAGDEAARAAADLQAVIAANEIENQQMVQDYATQVAPRPSCALDERDIRSLDGLLQRGKR